MRFKTKESKSKHVVEVKNEKRIQGLIFFERISILNKHLFISIPANLLCASMIFVSFFSFHNILLINWYGAVIGLSAIRLIEALYYRNKFNHPKLQAIFFTVFSGLSALLWGVAGFFLMPQGDMLHQMVIIIVLAGVTAGGSQTLQASFIASLLFILFSICPVIIWLFSQYEQEYSIIGITMLAYLIFMIIVAHRNSEQLSNVLRLSYENLELVNNLSLTNNQLAKMNHSLQLAEKKLKEMAYYDPLTGLANRKMLDILARKSLNYAKRHHNNIAVCFLDLDYFKNINDTLGHDAGDQVLKTVATRLQSTLRLTDTVARLGGDEFVIIVTELNEPRDVITLIKKIEHEIAEEMIVKNRELHVTMSIGISFYPSDGSDFTCLLQYADEALYAVKIATRNNYKFYSELRIAMQK